MPPARTPPQQPGLPIGEPAISQRQQVDERAMREVELEPKTQRVSDHRDQTPTQGPGSAAGEVGDSATRAAFIAGAPIHDGKAITPPAPAPAPAPPEVTSDPAAQPAAAPQPTANVALRTPVSFEPTNADEMYRYAQMLCRSSLLPRAFYDRDDKERRNPRIGDVHFVLVKGQALGIHPMTSIGNINIIDGKAEIGALLMLSLVRRSGVMARGGWKLVHSDERRAVFSTLRAGDDEWTTFEYTIEEAELMGLLDKGRDEWAKANNQWRKQPRTMLRRRCQSMLLREVYSDIVLGCYDHDELSEMHERERHALERAVQRALPEGAGPGTIEQMLDGAPAEFTRAYPAAAAVDPLKARIEAKRAAAGLVSRCSLCDTPLDPRDSDPCIACRPDAPAAG